MVHLLTQASGHMMKDSYLKKTILTQPVGEIRNLNTTQETMYQ